MNKNNKLLSLIFGTLLISSCLNEDQQYYEERNGTVDVTVKWNMCPEFGFYIVNPNVVQLNQFSNINVQVTDEDMDPLSWKWMNSNNVVFSTQKNSVNVRCTSLGTKVTKLEVTDGECVAKKSFSVNCVK